MIFWKNFGHRNGLFPGLLFLWKESSDGQQHRQQKSWRNAIFRRGNLQDNRHYPENAFLIWPDWVSCALWANGAAAVQALRSRKDRTLEWYHWISQSGALYRWDPSASGWLLCQSAWSHEWRAGEASSGEERSRPADQKSEGADCHRRKLCTQKFRKITCLPYFPVPRGTVR